MGKKILPKAKARTYMYKMILVWFWYVFKDNDKETSSICFIKYDEGQNTSPICLRNTKRIEVWRSFERPPVYEKYKEVYVFMTKGDLPGANCLIIFVNHLFVKDWFVGYFLYNDV